jgi:hypothetical protein
MILLLADARQSSIEFVEPADLAAAHERDSAASSPTNPATNPRVMNDGLDRTGFSVVVKNRACRGPGDGKSIVPNGQARSRVRRIISSREARRIWRN